MEKVLAKSLEKLVEFECSAERTDPVSAITEVLSDAPRAGRPATISPEQQTKLFAKACENPQESDRPIARWTAAELADEMVATNTISKISSRWVSQLLARAAIRPHRIAYWLFSSDKEKDPNFDQRVGQVCQAYLNAIADYETKGIHTICMDEMTEIQALERIAPDRLPIAGHSTKREYEYRRHGTTGLFGNLHVATGKIWCPLLRETRTEEDMLENLDNVLGVDPGAQFRLVMDNLNTHASESLVRYIAECIEYKDDLGKKGKRGILRSVKSRVKFLTDRTHRIQFLYMPRHCSWLNQIEIWFGTLQRKVTSAMSFTSVENLLQKIQRFICYDNASMAKPYRWTYTGRVLAA